MPVAILHFSDSNMAGYEWTWTFYLDRTANGRFTVSCKQMVTEESALRVPARKGLRDGADVYGALEEVVSEARYCLDDFDAGPIASEVKKVDPSLVDQFLRGPEILEQRQEKENEVRAAERERSCCRSGMSLTNMSSVSGIFLPNMVRPNARRRNALSKITLWTMACYQMESTGSASPRV